MKSVRFFLYPVLAAIMQFSFINFAYSQIPGCTDPQATNFNPDATQNDGSCVYPTTSVPLTVVVNALPQAVNETSGLIYWNGGLWTHNDSGNPPELYKIDTTTGQVLQTIIVSGVQNIDWEDVAQDNTHIYIGDFGNNAGNRTDLKVLKIQKADIPATGNTSVEPEIISFSYGDQNSFVSANRNNDYDCESMISYGDSLYLFTKNWVNQQTRLYALSKIPGNYEIFPNDNLNADGLITGADIKDGGEIVLIGYKNYNPFMWLLFDFQGSDFFGGNKRRINFTGVLGIQSEGIGYSFGSNVFISSEKTAVNPAKLFKLNTLQWTYSTSTGIEDMVPHPDSTQGMLIYPNPNNGNFNIEFDKPCSKSSFSSELYSASGNLLQRNTGHSGNCVTGMSFTGLTNGLYLLRCYSADKVFSARFMVCN
jgi:hypothetical protein